MGALLTVSSTQSIQARLKSNEPLKKYSTFQIGGAARYFIEVDSIELMSAACQFITREKLPYFVLGKGSNLLFDDRGFDGLVILNKIDFLEQHGEEVHVGAGYSFARLGARLSRNGWGGLEFASGIPGSVGGAVYMNAGAGGQETCDALTHVGSVDEHGTFTQEEKKDLDFRYRHSSFHKRKSIIVSARFGVHRSTEAREKQMGIVKYRTGSQPYSEPSAGCVFQNPESQSAGSLIEACGLKGYSIGDAVVSPMHANFIVNRGSATAQDVLALIAHIRRVVKERTGHDLNMELRYVSR